MTATPVDHQHAAPLDITRYPFKPLPQKGPDVSVERREDGCVFVRSNHPLAPPARSVGHLFAEHAAEHPERPFLMQRLPGHGAWRGVTYGEAARTAKGIAQWLLDQHLGPEDCVLVLSSNSVEHGLLMLGCYTAGVPIAPISPAHSLISTDHAKLKHAFQTLRPRIVFAQDAAPFARAFATLRAINPEVTFVTADGGEGSLSFAEIAATEPTDAVAQALDGIDHTRTGKYLFTSGSTGMPKCVPQTHGMMVHVVAASEGLRVDDGVERDPPQSLEWMPWSHISAGNIAFNGNLHGGGTLYLDEGKPLPGLFETTIKNLYEVSPVVFGSAPIAFAMLAEAMEQDPRLRASFFKNLIYMGYGGATLSSDVNERMQALAIAETGHRIPMTTMYGATETQGVTVVHWATERVGLIGLPLPGTTLKLVPSGDKLEVRVKGPTVTSGYHNDPVRTADAFDEEGYYRLGDAARFIDPEDPAQGLVFDGRITEDFKLDSGTWVSVGTLRPDVIAACAPYIQDLVIAGQDKPYIGVLAWPSAAALEAVRQEHPGADPFDTLGALVSEQLAAFNAGAGGSSRRVRRLILLREPPSIDGGELTDKGYVNQRATLTRRAEQAAQLYAEPLAPGVIDIR
ncbi:AMP-binding protein [Novosphingobium sp. KCTC 2891]|uniref:AMP-binding protein n=1 Tax=Novosphingobium sp. KCTC 2891 TaxID=2989730 RepID=UPI0022232603|nr:AMP-binding protein [Novosphingobium sp. KCTC 2891]MCW1381619.1 AMP-binding protein [Novosphingobium sp. KCTC 2891]